MADRARAGSGRLAIDRQRSLAASAGAVIRQWCRHAFDVCKRGDDLLDALVGKVLAGTPPTSASNYWEYSPVRQAIAPPAVSFYVARVRLTETAVEAAIAYTNYPTRESASTGTRRDQGALMRLRQRIPGGVWVVVEAGDVRQAMHTIERRAAGIEGTPFA